MSQASIIINVSEQEQSHANGLSGTWTVPGKKAGEDFAILVIYPTPEIQDIGEGRTTVHWLKARPLALDVVGARSDAASHGNHSPGTKEKWGLLLCEAEPDLPKELLSAVEREIEFLNDNPPDVKMRKDKKSGATVAVNIEPEAIAQQKIDLSAEVAAQRAKFVRYCRQLVTKAEVQRAKKNMLTEDQRLVAEADQMWAREKERDNVNDLHRRACARLGQERPWAYVPQVLVDCPGCGAKIKANVLTCGHCGGILDDDIEVIRALAPRERSMRMYPDRHATEPEPVAKKQ